MKTVLSNRLKYLYTGECFSMILFVPLSFYLNAAFPDLQLYSLFSFWVSFILLEFLLLQGAIYWYAKLKRLKKEQSAITPIKTVRLLHRLKIVNKGLIIAGVFAFGIDFIQHYPNLPAGGLLISFFIYIFAILEFINYFYTQLSYGRIFEIKNLLRNRTLKRSSLSKDFERMKNLH
ncbi:general stress protein [Jeotgalibacillus haloalkalitolerans]|uniref:General stress protein n=1 Tax=Jeotgalibacillus haloalkalitolerans TaxID=3104292 RepID=A0ABU5KHF7_9BACL|nr:general stress protein [Jeotgalibacillus sp. HH7-29]MDZ5710667.1 general stress protein [Jeotgalibacillus sp. HH7-29]